MSTTEVPLTGTLLVRRAWAWLLGGETGRSHIREYAGTFATEFTVLACQVLTYKLAAHYLGKMGFAEYAVARRTIAFIYPLPLLGMAVALPRYIAHTIGAGDDHRSDRYFGAAVWCIGVGLLACIVLMNLFPGRLAYLFFASTQYANLVVALSLMLIGLTLHGLVYSYFRGHLAMRWANLIQLINLGLIPVVAFVVFHGSVRGVLSALGVLTTLVAGVGLAFTPLRHAADAVLPEARELLRFGAQRVPGDFIQMALFTLPATFVAHLRGVEEAGFVAFGISVLTMIGSLFAPIGLILLPKAGQMFAAGAYRELRQHVWMLTKVTIGVSIIATLGSALFAGPVIRVYLGSAYSGITPLVQLVLLGAVPYCLHLVLRNVLDAFYKSSVTGLILGVSLLAFCVGVLLAHAFSPTMSGVAVALLAGLVILGGLTMKLAFLALRS